MTDLIESVAVMVRTAYVRGLAHGILIGCAITVAGFVVGRFV